MTSEAWPNWNVTKLEAASRQLRTAIRLLFAQDDAVSVHTLAHASFGLLKGLAEHHGERRVVEAAKNLSSTSKQSDFWTSFNRTGNFFKHADKDPTDLLTERPEEENEALISLAVEIYRDLKAPPAPEIEAFYLWWRCIHFDDIDDVTEPFISWLNANADRLHDETRSDLLALGNDLLTLLTSHEKHGGSG